ncbi:dTMP kinase [Streptomyces sp. NBC_00859]|uniref:dTMP kinase n=1 Tax=Streptomyces sp. NBC_00859 TaxID=2903682 RepID=UPI0038656AB8|nr:thymidylate kinase [Streptomyces sp. NBC_00859]WSZ86716.1 thymidylate kinase [Streptomyces sp. NBC_00859]
MPSTTTSHRFFVMEGIDGSGKTTTGGLIAAHVRGRGHRLSRIGQHSWLDPQAARKIITVRENEEHAYSPREIADAYFTDRRLQAAAVGRLLRDRSVLSDRFVFSEAVYMEALYGTPARETLDRYHASGSLFPDLIIYVDVPVGVATDRVITRGRGMRHYENGYALGKVSRIYRDLLLDNPPPYLPPVQVFHNSEGAHHDHRFTELAGAIGRHLSPGGRLVSTP